MVRELIGLVQGMVMDRHLQTVAIGMGIAVGGEQETVMAAIRTGTETVTATMPMDLS